MDQKNSPHSHFDWRPPSLRDTLALVVLALILPLALSTLYRPVQAWTGSPWAGALLVNALLAVTVLLLGARLKSPPLSRRVASRPFLAWIPSFVVFGGALLLIFMVAGITGETLRLTPVPSEQLWFIFVVPIVEEILFRLGIGAGLRRVGGVLWGAWFSAFVFAFVHSLPTLQSLISFEVGLPLGPFLLGLICEWIRNASGRIAPAILFHATCNATVLIFASGHPGIFETLNFLYS